MFVKCRMEGGVWGGIVAVHVAWYSRLRTLTANSQSWPWLISVQRGREDNRESETKVGKRKERTKEENE